MSTAVTAPEQPEQPEQPAQPAPEKQPWLRRIPAPLFVTAYGVLVIAVILGAAMAVGYTADAKSTAVDPPQPERPFNPAPADTTNIAESIRPHLITDVEVGETNTGAMLRGNLTEEAVAEPEELAGHLSRLLEQNCLDTVTLTSPRGMRVNFWGFCFATIPPETIQPLLAFADKEGADSLAFYDYAGRGHLHYVALNWMDAADNTEKLERAWDRVERPDDLDRITFNAYAGDDVVVMDNDKKTGKQTKHWETGEAFARRWGLDR